MGDDEPPPLEDMTEDLERMGRISSRSGASPQQNDTNSKTTSSSTTGEVSSKISDINKPVKKKAAQESKGFCGFQKGFLSGSSKTSRNTASSSSSSSEAIKKSQKPSQHVDDVIRPKNSSGKSELELPEVQAAMRETYPALATDKWLTEDLLKKIQEDPILAKGFSDPSMTQYLSLLQTNPKEAFAAAQGNPGLQKFMQAFCSTMGTHLTSLGDDEASLGRAAPEPAIVSEDEARVKKLLSMPEVSAALKDPQVMKLCHLLKTDPHAAQRLLSENKSADFSSKIEILLQNDLLSFQ